MKIQINWPIYGLITKFLITAIVAATLGIGLGLSQTYAESRINVNVPSIGNVGTAATFGNFEGTPIRMFAFGTSSSSVNLSYLHANIKIWHVGPLLQSATSRVWLNSRGGATNRISSGGFGDKATTQSRFRGTSSSSIVDYYTSFPDNTASCFNAWRFGNPC